MDQDLRSLRKRVNMYSSDKTIVHNFSINNFNPKNIRSEYIYGIVPVVILLVLILFRPSIIYVSSDKESQNYTVIGEEENNVNQEKRMSFIRIITLTMIVSFIFFIGIYISRK